MSKSLILLPVLLQIFLVIALFFLLAKRKREAVKNNLVDKKAAAINNMAWPKESLLVSNNISNQFELPVLFYITSIISYLTNTADYFSLGLASSFVVFRYIHSYIHVTSNYVPHRFLAFSLSLLTLFVFFLQISFNIIINA